MNILATLTDKEVDETKEILNMGLPRVYVREGACQSYMPCMHFRFITDSKDNILEIYECRGYHTRLLIHVNEGDWQVINKLSPYSYGVFYSTIEALNRYENHPLVKDLYSRSFMDGWSPDTDLLSKEDKSLVTKALNNAMHRTNYVHQNDTIHVEVVFGEDTEHFTLSLENKATKVSATISNVHYAHIGSMFGWQGLGWYQT